VLDPTSREYAAWAGPWAKHGASLDVESLGCGVLSWRTYRWCTPGIIVNCDWMRGNVIQYGGAAFVLDTRDGPAASGRIILTSNRSMTRDPGIVLRLRGEGLLDVEWDGAVTTFCRTWSWQTEYGGA
jgi:hypothetical protein